MLLCSFTIKTDHRDVAVPSASVPHPTLPKRHSAWACSSHVHYPSHLFFGSLRTSCWGKRTGHMSLGCTEVTQRQLPFCPTHLWAARKWYPSDKLLHFVALTRSIQKLLNATESFCSTVQISLREQNEAVYFQTA